MNKKAVLFDLDDTLYDYETRHRKSLIEVHKALKKHIDISFKKFLILYNLSRNEIHRELAGSASSHNRILYSSPYFDSCSDGWTLFFDQIEARNKASNYNKNRYYYTSRYYSKRFSK